MFLKIFFEEQLTVLQIQFQGIDKLHFLAVATTAVIHNNVKLKLL